MPPSSLSKFNHHRQRFPARCRPHRRRHHHPHTKSIQLLYAVGKCAVNTTIYKSQPAQKPEKNDCDLSTSSNNAEARVPPLLVVLDGALLPAETEHGQQQEA